MTDGQRELPQGWRKRPQNRPVYVRTDGVLVRLDGPATWGVYWPGEKRPSSKFPDARSAMDWLDFEFPVEAVS